MRRDEAAVGLAVRDVEGRVRIERGYRETGLSAAQDVLDDDARLLVLGPVGAGRTALLADLDAHEGRHRRIWWCRGRAGGPGGEPALYSAPLDALLELAAREPTTLLVDDLDRLDDTVLERLLLLVDRRAELGLRVAASQRPVPVRPALAAVDVALIGRFGALHLGPLTSDGVARWLVEQRGSSAGAAELTAASGGWPELVAAGLSAPTAVGDLARARLALLSGEQRRIVRAVCFGLPVGTAALATAADTDLDAIDNAIEVAATVGVLHDGSEPTPAVADAVCADSPTADRRRFAAVLTSAPPDVLLRGARRLLRTGDRSPEAGDAYERAADLLVDTDAAAAADLYVAAIRAGRPERELQGRRVAAELAAGRIEAAVELAGGAELAAGSSDDPLLHRSAAAGWSHLGRPDLAAGCYLAADDPVLAVLPLLAAGRAADARAALAASPLPAENPARLFGQGALAWIDGDVAGATELLGRSARVTEVVGGVEQWPDSPHAVVALAALGSLDDPQADRLVRGAIDRSVGGGAFAVRHRLVEAWTAARTGRTAPPSPPDHLAAGGTGRDALLAAATQAARAVREAEPAALPAIHRTALEAVAACTPDAFAAALVVELAHLSARVGDDPQRHLGPLEALSQQLGDPPGIALQLHWARVLVATLCDDAGSARRAADALTALAATPAIAADPTIGGPARLLADAAVTFADVLAGKVDADGVQSVATRLVEHGFVFEATRLVGTASLRSDDPVSTRTLLADLRRMRVTKVREGPGRRRPVAAMSEREREVARGVLDGRTHREIGAQLYISAKTVEHHVARIRQKLGAGSRAELLAAIREQLTETP